MYRCCYLVVDAVGGSDNGDDSAVDYRWSVVVVVVVRSSVCVV